MIHKNKDLNDVLLKLEKAARKETKTFSSKQKKDFIRNIELGEDMND